MDIVYDGGMDKIDDSWFMKFMMDKSDDGQCVWWMKDEVYDWWSMKFLMDDG